MNNQKQRSFYYNFLEWVGEEGSDAPFCTAKDVLELADQPAFLIDCTKNVTAALWQGAQFGMQKAPGVIFGTSGYG